jgi:hypothetical protein
MRRSHGPIGEEGPCFRGPGDDVIEVDRAVRGLSPTDRSKSSRRRGSDWILYLDCLCVVRTGRLVVRLKDILEKLGARILDVDASSERRILFKAPLSSAQSLLEVLAEWCASSSIEIKMGAPLPRKSIGIINKILRGSGHRLKRRDGEILFHASLDDHSIFGIVKRGKIIAKYCRRTMGPVDPGLIPPWLCSFQLQEVSGGFLELAGRRLMSFYEDLVKSAHHDVTLSSDPERDDIFLHFNQ